MEDATPIKMKNLSSLEINKMDALDVLDIRQSPSWIKSLEMYGWVSIYTSKNTNVEILKKGFGGFVKIQKPVPLTKEDLEEIEQIAQQHKALFVKIEPNAKQDKTILEENGYLKSQFILTPTKTIRLNLQKSEEELWKDLSHSARYSINRARREGIKVEFCQNPIQEKLKDFYEIYRETGKLKAFEARSLDDLKKRTADFGNESFLVLTYDKNNILCGGKYYLGFNKNIWYIYGGTTAFARKNKSGYLLLWASMMHFKKLGYLFLDLDGIYDSRFPRFLNAWGGFSHFKEKFGGEVVTFPIPYVKYFHPFMKFISRLTGVNI